MTFVYLVLALTLFGIAALLKINEEVDYSYLTISSMVYMGIILLFMSGFAAYGNYVLLVATLGLLYIVCGACWSLIAWTIYVYKFKKDYTEKLLIFKARNCLPLEQPLTGYSIRHFIESHDFRGEYYYKILPLTWERHSDDIINIMWFWPFSVLREVIGFGFQITGPLWKYIYANTIGKLNLLYKKVIKFIESIFNFFAKLLTIDTEFYK